MPALSMNDSVTMLRVLMPQSWAAVRLAAQARISRPTGVARKNRCRPATMMAQAPSTNSTCGDRWTLPRFRVVTSLP